MLTPESLHLCTVYTIYRMIFETFQRNFLIKPTNGCLCFYGRANCNGCHNKDNTTSKRTIIIILTPFPKQSCTSDGFNSVYYYYYYYCLHIVTNRYCRSFVVCCRIRVRRSGARRGRRQWKKKKEERGTEWENKANTSYYYYIHDPIVTRLRPVETLCLRWC